MLVDQRDYQNKIILEKFMKDNLTLIDSCRKQEILEFSNFYVGIQHIFRLVHYLKIYIVDKVLPKSNQLSLLEDKFIQTHYENCIVKIIYDEIYYTELSLNKAYDEQKILAIQKYSECQQPIIDLQQEIPSQNVFDLSSLIINDENKIKHSHECLDLQQNQVFKDQIMRQNKDYNTKLKSFVAIEIQNIKIKQYCLQIDIGQYWLLQQEKIRRKYDQDSEREEIIIEKNKSLYYYIIINQKFCKVSMLQEEVEKFIQLFTSLQFEIFILHLTNKYKIFQPIEMETTIFNLISKVKYYIFRDCTFRIIETINIQFDSLNYALELMNIDQQFTTVLSTQNINDIIYRLDGFEQLDISQIVQDSQLFYQYFTKQFTHKLQNNQDPELIEKNLTFGSILLSDRSVYQHAAIYLGCDLVFHYSDQRKDNENNSLKGHFFQPERFEVFMKDSLQLTEIKFAFLLRNKLELIDKALLKQQENFQYDLTKYNCEHLAFEVITNFKFSSQIDQNIFKNIGANVAKFFGLYHFSSQSSGQ